MPTDDFWADLPGAKTKRQSSRDPSLQPPAAEHASPRDRVKLSIGLMSQLIRILFALCLGIGLGLGLLIVEGLNRPAAATETPPKIITIDRGLSSEQVAQLLEEKGLIISHWPFLLYVKLNRLTLKAGVYQLDPAQSAREIAAVVSGGKTADQTITIPEGWRLEQIAARLNEAGITNDNDFLRAARYDPVRYTLPPGITLTVGDSLEGLLFPDTYRFPYGVTSKEIVTELLANFARRTSQLALTHEDVILASIVEREAKKDEDRPKIAGVYRNRLTQNLRLQADPTVQYGKDTAAAKENDQPTGFNWWSPITQAEYQAVKSPYNTYLVGGLPPGPIANPGLASLIAAKQPAAHSDFFFFHLRDGTTVYSKTAEEHAKQQQLHAGQ